MVISGSNTYFLSCDWGSSRFRLRLVDRSRHQAITEHLTGDGIQVVVAAHADRSTRPNALARVLESGLAALGVADRSDIPVVISGMATSTLGWHPLPYAPLPAPINGGTLRFHDLDVSGRQVRLISGLQSASDVMRGEETELVGLFADAKRRALAADCLVILPGTHAKHVRLRANEIVGFTTYLTGELFSLLARNSTLDLGPSTRFHRDAFLHGVRTARESGLSAGLFQTRARTVLGLMPAEHGRPFLSGVVIGAEIAAMAANETGPVLLAASETFAEPYALAMAELRPGLNVIPIPPSELADATVRGHARLLVYT